MDEISRHLDVRWQELADMEKQEDLTDDEIYDAAKEHYDFDLQIYEALTIHINIAETRLAAELEARHAASLKTSQTPSPTAPPPSKKAKRDKNGKK